MRPDPMTSYRIIRDAQQRAINEAALERAAQGASDDRHQRPPRGPLVTMRRALGLAGPTGLWSRAAAARR